MLRVANGEIKKFIAQNRLFYKKIVLYLFAEKRVHNATGRTYFVNHNTKTTHWEDPRTPG